MSPRRRSPRPDAIDLLCGGISVPLAPLKTFHMIVILEWIARAWAGILADHTDYLISDDEDAVTFYLGERLQRLLEDDNGLLATLVADVERRAFPNYNGQELTKQPDLSITLTNHGRNFPLQIEAKIIDSGRSVSRYCTDGLIRFVDGDYGWSRCDGVMVAYVRNRAAITPSLSGYLKTRGPAYRTETLPTAVVCGGGDAAWSRHGRTYSYRHGACGAPGPIIVWHLWLAASGG